MTYAPLNFLASTSPTATASITTVSPTVKPCDADVSVATLLANTTFVTVLFVSASAPILMTRLGATAPPDTLAALFVHDLAYSSVLPDALVSMNVAVPLLSMPGSTCRTAMRSPAPNPCAAAVVSVTVFVAHAFEVTLMYCEIGELSVSATLASTGTAVAWSAGDDESNVGASLSTPYPVINLPVRAVFASFIAKPPTVIVALLASVNEVASIVICDVSPLATT